jgi:Zn-dependent protease with chaperone function
MHSRRVGGFALLVSPLWLLFLCFPSRALSAEKHNGPDHLNIAQRDPKWIQDVVDDFLSRLAMTQNVRVSLVPKNALMVSVETDDDDADAFLLSLEGDFLDELSEDELRAAVAHELGHVWIFKHHPYLQTEALANEIALRLVTRDSLVRVYEKVWRRLGTKGDLARFVGD